MARGLVCHGSYSYPSRRRGSHMINTIQVEEERAAAQSRASSKDRSLVRLGFGRAARSLATNVGVPKRFGVTFKVGSVVGWFLSVPLE